MSDQQPEALLLAECLEQHEYCTHGQMDRAAAELRRLHEVEQQRDELLAALRNMVEMFKNVPTLEQNSFDEPPEPRTQWDYEAYQMIGAACAAIAKAEGKS